MASEECCNGYSVSSARLILISVYVTRSLNLVMSCLDKDMSTLTSSILDIKVYWHMDNVASTLAVSAVACSTVRAAGSPSSPSWSCSCRRYLFSDEVTVLFLFGGGMLRGVQEGQSFVYERSSDGHSGYLCQDTPSRAQLTRVLLHCRPGHTPTPKGYLQ